MNSVIDGHAAPGEDLSDFEDVGLDRGGVEITRDNPTVVVPGQHRDDQDEDLEIGNDDFATAVLASLPAGILYKRFGVIGQLVGDPGELRFAAIGDARVRLLVDEHVRLVKWVRPKTWPAPRRVYVNATRDMANLILEAAKRSDAVRELRTLANYPIYGPPGFNLAGAGWNPDGTYYDEPASLRGLAIIDDPVAIHAALRDLVIDFPFSGEASRENYFGELLTPLIVKATESNIPAHVHVASLPRSGKTLLAAEVTGRIITGKKLDPMVLSEREEEREKRFLGAMLACDPVNLVDNVSTQREVLESPLISALLTSRSLRSRLHYKNDTPAFANDAMLILTGNNLRCTEELAKRSIPVQIQPLDAEPENRTVFVHDNISAYLTDVRPCIVGCILGMIERWKAAGMPNHPAPLGGFEGWSHVVGGALRASGFTHWRENHQAWVRQANPQNEDLRVFVAAWWDKYSVEDKKLRPSELWAIAEEIGVYPEIAKDKTIAGRAVSFSRRVLRPHTNSPVDRWIIRASGSGSTSLYYLEEIHL